MSVVADPTLRPQTSLRNRTGRFCWGVCRALLYRPSPRPCHAWRAMLLRIFGAKLGAKCHFYPGSKVWAPWNLHCEDRVTLGDGAEIYNPSSIYLGSHAIVSQGAYVCGATHHYNEPEFPMVSYPMRIGAYAWVCARAIVGPGVNVGEGAVLGLGSVATKHLEAFGVYAGSPAKKVKERSRAAVGARKNAGPSTTFGATPPHGRGPVRGDPNGAPDVAEDDIID